MSEIDIPDTGRLILDGLFLTAPAQVNRSSWTGTRKVVGLPGAEVWRGKASIQAISTEASERPWRAFLFGLRGPVNWFRWLLPCNKHIGDKPTVDVYPSDGYELPLAGGQPNARILRAGQFMTVPLPSGHARAVCLTADLRFDADGFATAQFEPALGEVPEEGAAVETVDPYIPMALVDAEQGLAGSQGVSGASFDVEETR